MKHAQCQHPITQKFALIRAARVAALRCDSHGRAVDDAVRTNVASEPRERGSRGASHPRKKVHAPGRTRNPRNPA